MKLVSYNCFKKLDLRIVTVIKAEEIPKKNKIIKLTIDSGIEDTKTIIAGGAEYYKPEFFLNKKFLALINLEPKKIAGIESNGMLLAAIVGDKPFWLKIDDEVPIGSKII